MEPRFEKDNTMNMTIERSSDPLCRTLHRGVTSLLAMGLAATALTGCSASGNQASETTHTAAASSEATGATEQVVELSDGRTQKITVPVRDYAGAQEHYAPGEEHNGHGEHSQMPSAESSALPECHEH